MVKTSLRLSSLALALLLAATLTPSEAAAKKRKKSKKSVVALFLSAKNKPNSKLYASLLAGLTRSAAKAKPIKILYGKNLRKVLKSKPEKAIGKCGSNVACISKLGQKARAEVVVYGRVSPDGSGIKAQLLVVDVASSSISERMALSFSSTADVETKIAARLDALYPVGTAMAAAEEEIPFDMILGGEEEPAAETTVADASSDTATGGDEIPLDFALAEPETTAATEPDPVLDDPLELAAPPPPTEIAAISPGLATTTGPDSTSSGGSRALTYTGIAVAGLGVGALGVGGYFGMASTSTRDSIEYGAGGTTQAEAVNIGDDANDQAGMANLMFGVGGGLVAVGAVLIALDLLVLDGGGPETSVSVGSEAAAATFTWKF